MFVPVACSECGKPFQVPEAAVGKPTACPWCQAAVLALPVGGPAPAGTVAKPPENRGPTPPDRQDPAPLSLDDEPPAPAAPPARRLRVWVILLALLFAAVATAVTLGLLRRKEGHFVDAEWRTFTSADGSCSLDLLGRAADDPDAQPGEKRYVSEGWYSGTTAWVGWRDLTAGQAQQARTEDAWQHFKPLFDAERDRLRSKYGGSVTKDGTTKFKDPLTHEVRMDYPQGKLVERMMVMPNGPRPRVYFVGIAGKKLDPDGPEAKRLFDSFRVFE
jgi:hypothetical protein